MIEVFVCCSPADREVAKAIASRLERCAEAAVQIDDSPGETLAEKWEAGLSSTGILLLLSPDAVPALNRENWEALLHHSNSGARPRLGSVLVRECAYPRLLERKNFFRWTAGPCEALRGVERWTMEMHELPEQRFGPARLPWFQGRRQELEQLWDALVDNAGLSVLVQSGASNGKTSLAQEFARQAGPHFRDVLWVSCSGRSREAIAGNLAEQLGVELRGMPEDPLASVLESAGKHRVLVVLDDLAVPLMAPVSGRLASVLITGRSQQPRTRRIRLEGRPQFAPGRPAGEADSRLWRAMAVCRPQGFPLDLAARVADLPAADARAACARLVDLRLADPFDAAGEILRLNALSFSEAGRSVDLQPLRRRHAESVDAALVQLAGDCARCEQYLAEFQPAFEWAAANDWPLAVSLGRHAFAYLRGRSRRTESDAVLVALRNAADRVNDWWVADECSWELSWIRNVPHTGRGRDLEEGDQLGFDFG